MWAFVPVNLKSIGVEWRTHHVLNVLKVGWIVDVKRLSQKRYGCQHYHTGCDRANCG
jgi:hypothetical protein